MSFYSDLNKAVESADLVIEAVPEVVDIKTDFYKKLGEAAPEKNDLCYKFLNLFTKPVR